MNRFLEKIYHLMSFRLGFITSLIGFYWLKSIWAYQIDFHLGLENIYQLFLSLINPIPLALFLMGLAIFIKKTKAFYWTSLVLYGLLNLLLVANAIYFREFSDFITISTILATSKVSAGLGDAAINLFRPWDVVYLLDVAFLIYVFRKDKVTLDHRSLTYRLGMATTSFAALLFSINLFLAEIDRPELLSRGFSNTYVVRALGLPAFLGYDGNQTYKTQKVRSEAKPEEINMVIDYVNQHRLPPNPEFFGLAKGRNVIILHLESIQQFLIDYKLESNGQAHEVMPFINSLYHDKQTISFENFFHQVKAGKTSDAETIMELSLFGLNQGSYFVQYGGDNTQQAAPYILNQVAGYSSAVFHGNIGTFWNRNNVYKQWGYQNWIDQSYMSKPTKDNSFQYGLNDKVMFADAIPYLERLQQPFYTKFLAVSNHYPYQNLTGDEVGFPLAETNDETINHYFATANYLDDSIKAFFDYLKATGLYENSIILLYGDHYGISNSRNPDLAPLIGKNPETWTDYDNAMLQRVPFMIHIPGVDKGFISPTFGGEIDALPTLFHLLGIDNKPYLHLGQDLLAQGNAQTVAFRTSSHVVAPDYTSYAGKIYNTTTGEEITHPDETTLARVQELRDAAKQQLTISDKVQTGDLLRFYTGSGLAKINLSSFTYTDALEQLAAIEDQLGDQSTSLYSKRGNQTSQDLFKALSYKELHPPTSSSSQSQPAASNNPSQADETSSQTETSQTDSNSSSSEP